MIVGIDSLAFYTARYALKLETLAAARGVDPAKYTVGLGQYTMSVAPPGEDIVTMAANAAERALTRLDYSTIKLVLFATESGIDHSKAAALYVHRLLGLDACCRVVELKQACYSGTAALQLALTYVKANPTHKVLVIASDIARYGLATSGESSQGCGAVAFTISENPHLVAIEDGAGWLAADTMDFWRPNYRHEAIVDGKYSSKLYLEMLVATWQQYVSHTKRSFMDHFSFCYHAPVPRLVEKAHEYLLKFNQINLAERNITAELTNMLAYTRQIGNSYSASLYIGLASLLENNMHDLSGTRIGFYSYGSGCMAEFFSGIVQPNYRAYLATEYHAQLLAERSYLNYADYENFYQFKYCEDGSQQIIPNFMLGNFRLAQIYQHKRIYEKNIAAKLTVNSPKIVLPSASTSAAESSKFTTICAPGKLILSGEHAVVYGQPALAMAINRYVRATITRDETPSEWLALDLTDLSYRGQLTLTALRRIKNKLKTKYQKFMRGEYSIHDVLQKPFLLAQYALGICVEAMNFKLSAGVKLSVQSDLPIGCGLGSSAATIISIMQALARDAKRGFTHDELFSLALQVEHLQHGYSSGLDLRLALHGGCIYMERDLIETREIPQLPMYLINTGVPRTSTGECVTAVAEHFKSSLLLGNEFGAITRAMDYALQHQKWEELGNTIKQNHELLVRIGIVPVKVQQLITQLNRHGCYAKVCGAGAVAGNNAGAVWVVGSEPTKIISSAQDFGYSVIEIAGELRGVHAA